MNIFIYGKNQLTNVVNVSYKDDNFWIFQEFKDHRKCTTLPANYWILFPDKLSNKFVRLDGDLHYKYIINYDSIGKFRQILNKCKREHLDHYALYNPVNSMMTTQGVTYFKGMTPKDVSILSFDLETTGLMHDRDSKVLLISNTFRSAGGKVEKKLFAIDEYDSDAEMIRAWCEWVQLIDPSIILGHNILGFDLPYLRYCSNDNLPLGRDCSNTEFSSYTSQFRKDGSQTYDYNDVTIFGREVIDTFFLSIKYDVKRKYESYGLKSIIKKEGLEKGSRQFYDAKTIRDNYKNLTEWAKIKAYAIDDADDALALYDLMVNAYFYYTQSMPKTFQQINNGATGSQINSFLVRSYLQEGHSIPKKSPPANYEGAISFGVPGLHKNCFKIDVASLYPSIILQYQVYDRTKDPKQYFLKMIDYFTQERLKNKQLAKETGDKYYEDLEQAQKIVINSGYGFLGAPNLNFNSPQKAAFVTQMGREILQQAIKWASGRDYDAA